MARILIGYDIHDPKRRRWACKTLRALTACYQQSFFDCQLSQPEVAALFSHLCSQLNPEQDGLIIARLQPEHSHAIGQRWTHGGASLYLVN